jgi:hypothetical protein
MSWRGALPWSRQQRRSDHDSQDLLKRLGLSVVKDEKLDERVKNLEQFHKYVEAVSQPKGKAAEERAASLRDQLQLINKQLQMISVPWGRAGSVSWYAEAMRGWTGIHTITVDIADSVLALMRRSEYAQAWHNQSGQTGQPNNPGPEGRDAHGQEQSGQDVPERQKEELFAKLQHFVTRFYVRYAMLIASISWFGEDVAPSWSAVVQYPFMPYGGERAVFQGGYERSDEDNAEHGQQADNGGDA